MNKAYIDKHEAYLLLKQKAETCMLPATKEAYEGAARLIDSIKTCDVQPVKRGRWIPHTKQIVDIDIKLPTECSECGFEEFSAEKYNFCPECGVEMLK